MPPSRELRAEPLEPATNPALGRPERHADRIGDRVGGHAARIRERECLALLVRNRIESTNRILDAAVEERLVLGPVGAAPRYDDLLLKPLRRRLASGTRAPAIERPAAAQHRDVARQRSAAAVEARPAAPEVGEDVLGDVLSGGAVAEDTVRRPQSERIELVVGGGERHRIRVAPELLRAWERRYGLLTPERTGGGLRLYSLEDEARVRRMQAFLAEGLAAGEAARAALRAAPSPLGEPAEQPGARVEDRLRALELALERFDGVSAQRAIDGLRAELSLDPFLSDAVLPFLRRLGERWAAGEVSVAQEHFASNLLRDRLHTFAQGWDAGAGPRALLACPPGESHHLGLSCFGLALRARGWRITFLGAETPFETILDTVRTFRPDLTAMSAVDPARFAVAEDQLAELARATPLLLAGDGAGPRIAERAGARLVDTDPVSAAEMVARERASARDGG